MKKVNEMTEDEIREELERRWGVSIFGKCSLQYLMEILLENRGVKNEKS